MRQFFPSLICVLLLAACAENMGAVDPNLYKADPQLRSVNVDDHRISVVPVSRNEYVAWGGETDRDGQIQYRQRRAIELVSKCRVSKVIAKKTDTAIRAQVKC